MSQPFEAAELGCDCEIYSSNCVLVLPRRSGVTLIGCFSYEQWQLYADLETTTVL